MEETPDTLRVCFEPARANPDGPAVICRLPCGRVALPARLTWNQPPPRPFEVWLVRPCGDEDGVTYVKPLRRLAEAPFAATPAGVLTNRLLLRLFRPVSLLLTALRRSRRLSASSRTD